jgi:SAM-dependent methyltransferase
MKDTIKGFWRLLQPIRTYGFKYPIQLWVSYFNFYKSWKQYKKLNGHLTFRYIAPVLHFKQEDIQTGGGHYFFQDIWALRHLSAIKPTMHYDIGSRIDGFTGQATAICPVTCIDIRPPHFQLRDFCFLEGDIQNLPFESNSLNSVSCLHTIEHIGLGRYGDAINPDGFRMALLELQRVIATGGFLILSMPVGNERVEFNAQRILAPTTCINYLTEMQLLEFTVIDDQNQFVTNANPKDYSNSRYCCGMYLFKKN